MLAVKIEEVEVGDVIPADHQEVALFEVFLGVFHASCGPELDFLMDVGDVGPKERAVSQRLSD
ncbi:MAG: hypothetical protein A4E40_00636 [Methanoregulaceae archaeon PtaU1.Bin059]|nr:MAG: hypothetical protein A4E40_00636 [Methanoregulaceae archaeon PtaU1.Bin059]